MLVSTTAGEGHFGPVVPFARACSVAGHDVAVAAPESFGPQVAAAGFTHLPFPDVPQGEMARVFERLPDLTFEEANEVVLTEVMGRLDAQAALPEVTRIIRDWRPDIVLRDPAEFAALTAACAAGVEQAMVAIGMRATMSYILDVVRPSLGELDALAGLEQGTSAAQLGTSTTVTCVPALLDGATGDRAPGPARIHRFSAEVEPPPAEPLPWDWGDPSHPLVYVSFGSVTAGLDHLAGLYPAVVEALADQPIRVLLTTGPGSDPMGAGPVPGNVHVEQWWAQAKVLARAAAVVGHGGFGTTMGAAAAGVPQVIVPLFTMDQRINAQHLAAAGAGIHLEGGPAAVAALPDAVMRVLADGAHRTAARAVQAEMTALPPVTDAVPLLEKILG